MTDVFVLARLFSPGCETGASCDHLLPVGDERAYIKGGELEQMNT